MIEYFDFNKIYKATMTSGELVFRSLAMGIRTRESVSRSGEPCTEIQWVRNSHDQHARRAFVKIISYKGNGYVKAIDIDEKNKDNIFYEFEPLTIDNIESMLDDVGNLDDIIDKSNDFNDIENWFHDKFMPVSWTPMFPN